MKRSIYAIAVRLMRCALSVDANKRGPAKPKDARTYHIIAGRNAQCYSLNLNIKQTTLHTYKIAVLVGSLRKESYNLKTAKTLISLAPESLAMEQLQIGDLPLYNEDLEANLPDQWRRFREHLRNFDGVLFVTPEYNRSVPAVLKNAIDVGSRPYGQNVWEGKPRAVVSVSPGSMGGFGANQHLRQSLIFINVPAMPQPEVYIGGAAKLFDEKGTLINDATREFLKTFMQAFEKWVAILVKK